MPPSPTIAMMRASTRFRASSSSVSSFIRSCDRVGRLRELEIETRDASGVVRRPQHAGLPPADEDVRMVIALLGDHADANREGERGCEVGELERANEGLAFA